MYTTLLSMTPPELMACVTQKWPVVSHFPVWLVAASPANASVDSPTPTTLEPQLPFVTSMMRTRIVVGVGAVVCMVSVGAGAQAEVSEVPAFGLERQR